MLEEAQFRQWRLGQFIDLPHGITVDDAGQDLTDWDVKRRQGDKRWQYAAPPAGRIPQANQ